MLRELAKHNFPLRCLPILVTGFFNGLDRFGCGRTLHNPISRAKGGRPSETHRSVVAILNTLLVGPDYNKNRNDVTAVQAFGFGFS